MDFEGFPNIELTTLIRKPFGFYRRDPNMNTPFASVGGDTFKWNHHVVIRFEGYYLRVQYTNLNFCKH